MNSFDLHDLQKEGLEHKQTSFNHDFIGRVVDRALSEGITSDGLADGIMKLLDGRGKTLSEDEFYQRLKGEVKAALYEKSERDKISSMPARMGTRMLPTDDPRENLRIGLDALKIRNGK